MGFPSARFDDLTDRGVLITGGGSGIGAALVEAFARQNARVAFLDIADAPSEALVARLSGEVKHAPVYLRADLRHAGTLGETVDAAISAIGPITVLINNAARDDRQSLEAITVDSWDENQAVNLRHVLFMIQAVVPSMRAAGGGSIVNFSSIAYLLNMPELPAYAAAKAGIVGLTKSLAGALGPDKIRINAILPGMVVTERQRALWVDDASLAAMLEKQCLKQAILAEDLVGPCLYLASDCSVCMTAQTMIIDGGAL